jgi:hypothetical protein
MTIRYMAEKASNRKQNAAGEGKGGGSDIRHHLE